MGAAGSTPTFQGSPAFVKTVDVAVKPEISTVKDFVKTIDDALIYHKAVLGSYKTLAAKYANSSEIKMDEVDKATFLNYLIRNKGENIPEDHIVFLNQINAIWDEDVPLSNDPNKRTVHVFPDFELGYERFITILTFLKNHEDVKLEKDPTTVTDPGLIAQHARAREVINKFLTRILFLNYAIAYNDYLSMLYTMYATRQFRALDVMYTIAKKGSEFADVIDALDKELNSSFEPIVDNQTNLKTKTDKNVSDLSGIGLAAMAQANQNKKEFDQSGGVVTGQSDKLIEKLIALHKSKLEEYNTSNEYLEKYFAMINKVLSDKFEELHTKFKEIMKQEVILNPNVMQALEQTISHIGKLEQNINMKKFGESGNPESGLNAKQRADVQAIIDKYEVEFTDDERAKFLDMVRDGLFLKTFTKMQSKMSDTADSTLNAIDNQFSAHERVAMRVNPIAYIGEDDAGSQMAQPSVPASPRGPWNDRGYDDGLSDMNASIEPSIRPRLARRQSDVEPPVVRPPQEADFARSQSMGGRRRKKA